MRSPIIRNKSASKPNSVGPFPGCDLELARVSLYDAVASIWTGFSRLASLNLEECHIYSCGDPKSEFDLFAEFPCLKNLVLVDCNFINSGKCFKITGPQLVNLEIHGVKKLGCARVEIAAPKLKSLSLVLYLDVPKFSRFSLPLLDHANLGIKIAPYFLEERRRVLTASFVTLFQALHNAASLRFDNHIVEAMSMICDGLKHYRCPFTRLQCLKVPRSREPETIPDQLISYFLKGSSSTNAGFLQFV
ncbi:unnamed protein product [Linum trigynum]|uniref:Uncharacterized protein n=1 Tax=Linum trigynum TaxID=586398 RepID=A0AAV2DQF1_9ROSI